MTHEEAWHVASEVAGTGINVKLVAHDGVEFFGLLMHVDYDYLVLDGKGFPLEDVDELEPQYVSY